MTEPSSRYPPSRRPRISQEYLEERRRRRFVDAVAELLHEFGRQGVSVTNIVRLAGTARNSFYEVFRSADDCIAFGATLALGELFETLDTEASGGEWLLDVHRAITGFYDAVVARPLLAELLLIHSRACKVEEGRSAERLAAERFVPLLGRGRIEAEALGRRASPASAEEFFSRSIVTLATRRVREPGLKTLSGEARVLSALIGAAYLGAEEADRLLGDPTAELLVP